MPPRRIPRPTRSQRLLDSLLRLGGQLAATAGPECWSLPSDNRDLETLADIMVDEYSNGLMDCYTALEASPAARAALVQLLSAALRDFAAAAAAESSDRATTDTAPSSAVQLGAPALRSGVVGGKGRGAAEADATSAGRAVANSTALAHALSYASSRRNDDLLHAWLSSLHGSGYMEVWVRAATEWGCGEPTNGPLQRYMVLDVLGTLREACHYPAAVSSRQAIYSGPCLQYWLALHVVSQLHAADGGPLYGLPPAALLPPLWTEHEDGYLLPDGHRDGRRQRQRQLSCRCVSLPLDCWAWCLDARHPVPLGPLRPRALLALALRTARVAVASCELHEPRLVAVVEAVQRRCSLLYRQQHGQQQQQQQQHHYQQQHGRQQEEAEEEEEEEEGAVWDGYGSSCVCSTCGACRACGGFADGTGDGGGGSGGTVELRRPFHAADCSSLALKALRLGVRVMEATGGEQLGGKAGRRRGGAGSSNMRAGGISGGGSGGGDGDSGSGSGGSTSSRDCGLDRAPFDRRLCDASFAAEWWPLALRAVRAALGPPGGVQEAAWCGSIQEAGWCGSLLAMAPVEPRGELHWDDIDGLGEPEAGAAGCVWWPTAKGRATTPLEVLWTSARGGFRSELAALYA